MPRRRFVPLFVAIAGIASCVPHFTVSDAARDVASDASDDGAIHPNPIGPIRTTFTPSGPITATTGQVITGLHITSTSGPCITIRNATDVRVTDNEIGPCGAPGDSNAVGIDAETSSGIVVDHNLVHDVATGFRASSFTGPIANVVFDHNRVGDVFGPSPSGHMVQFADLHGSGLRVSCNIHDQARRTAYETDAHIAIHASSGTTTDPITVAYNRVRGSSGSSTSGCGVTVCTGEGCGYIDAHHNVAVNPGGCGFGVAGGHHVTMANNTIFIAQGETNAEIGAYLWNQSTGTCSDNTLRDNRVFAYRRDGARNDFWNAGDCTNTTDENNTWGDTALTAAAYDAPFTECD